MVFEMFACVCCVTFFFLQALIENLTFYECVLACSLEIVIYSHNCQKKFPWILEALEIQPYYFVKIIELIVRTKDQFSRDVVKHLNTVCEICVYKFVATTNIFRLKKQFWSHWPGSRKVNYGQTFVSLHKNCRNLKIQRFLVV